ncbi:MAG: DNA-processing protein DprA [Pseudomonadota bacterium]
MADSTTTNKTADRRAWLSLIRAFAGTTTSGVEALQRFGGCEPLLRASEGELAQAGIGKNTIARLANPDSALLDSDQRWLDQPGCDLVTWHDEGYPPQLRDVSDPPLALFCRGNPQLLWLPQLAIVGTRNPSSGGLRHAQRFAAALAAHGLVITSGLALGVDGAAHRATLNAGGLTIAVAATGPDRIYPARHVGLATDIVRSGLIVSEFPPGWEPRRRSFPQRNRLISGLSLAVLVIEASVQSGSLITARIAGEQGRDVYALPGSIDNPMARGCHRLIKQGARLLEDADELIRDIAPRARKSAALRREQLGTPAKTRAGQGGREGAGAAASGAPGADDFLLDDDYKMLFDAVGFDELSVDLLVESTGLTAASVSSMLLILELRGLVQMGPGGGYCRTGEGWQ